MIMMMIKMTNKKKMSAYTFPFSDFISVGVNRLPCKLIPTNNFGLTGLFCFGTSSSTVF